PQTITGLEKLVRKLELIDVRHDRASLLQILNTFVGTYQMLPSPFAVPAVEPLYRAETYGDLQVPQNRLDAARAHHEGLRDVVDPRRMVQVAGANKLTWSNINNWQRFLSHDDDEARSAYDATNEGDGRVTHELGRLRT